MNEDVNFELHPSQQDVFFDQLLDSQSPIYNIGGYIRLRGVLDVPVFKQAVASGSAVFDAFRISFDLSDPAPVAYLQKASSDVQLEEIDFSSHANPDEAALQWIRERFNSAFILEKNQIPFEQRILKISENEYWFYGRYHHLITDGYGFVAWVKYLSLKYKLLKSGDQRELVFPRYCEEANKAAVYKNSAAYTNDEKYWKEKISSPPDKIFQKNYFNSRQQTSETFHLTLNAGQRNNLVTMEKTRKIRLHHLTIAALIIYFGKTSKPSEFIFGIPVHKRNTKEARNIVGMFSGIIPFKGSYSKETLLSDLLTDIVNTQKQDYNYQNYLVGDLARTLKINAADDYLFDITINYKLLNFELDFGEELEAGICEISNEFQKNPLQLCWQDYGNDQPLLLQLDYNLEYFNRNEIQLLAERILYILQQFPACINGKVGDINVIPPAEKKIVNGFSRNMLNYRTVHNDLVALFQQQVLQSPDAIALTFKEDKITYGELNKKANRFARYLQSIGIKKGTLVPLCLSRSSEMIVSMIAILKVGAAYIPIDPSYPLERINYIIDDTGAQFLLTDKFSKDHLSNRQNIRIIEVENISSLSEWDQNPDTAISPRDLAYVIYTSGSTGKPKGVMIEHGSVVNLILAQSAYFNITPQERILQFSNYCFDASVEQIFLSLLNGATLVLFSEGLQLNEDEFQKFIIENEITHLHTTPSFLETLSSFECPSLKRVIAGGDICKIELAKKWKNTADFYNEYGPTETTVTAIEYKYDVEDKTSSRVFPIGQPLPHVQVLIVNDKLEILPVGATGEICIGGIQVARGYLNNKELTIEKFIENPFADDGGKLYKTGDFGRWRSDGNLEYLGRMDDQVKIRGYRIELGEIESTLNKSERVKQSVVIAPVGADGHKQLVAYIIPVEKLDNDEVIKFLKTRLPDYMMPGVFIQLNELPVNSNGKIDKKSLPDPGINYLPDSVYEAPSTDMENTLTVLWEEILGVEKISIHDNFFALGGHSLSAMQLSSRLHKQFRKKIDVGQIFKNPTIKQLAEILISERQREYEPIKKLPQKKFYDLSHAQKRFWVLSHYKDASKAYNFSSAFVLEGLLNETALRQAFQEVIRRHEVLRTIFVEVEGAPSQQILSPEESTFQIEKINIPVNENEIAIIDHALEKESSYQYDLSNEPLLRSKLFYQSATRSILLFSIHHIISDGWSAGIFMKEILEFYNFHAAGKKISLHELPVQYKDYAAWHASIIQDQKDFWKEQFIDGIPVLDFPCDFERPKMVTFLGSMLHETIMPPLARRLKEMAAAHSMSLNNLLVAIYGLHVSHHTGQNDIVIGSLTAGRSHLDIENLIGAFINFLPIRLAPAKKTSLTAYLQQCNNILNDCYQNQDYPFDLMVDELISKRDFSRNPFFDTMVNFHLENEKKVGNDPIENGTQKAALQIFPFESSRQDIYQSVMDFKLDIEPSDTVLNLYLSYNSKLFTKDRMAGFLENFLKLLQKVTMDESLPLPQYDEIILGKEGLKIKSGEDRSTKKNALPVHICSSFVAEPLTEYLEYWNNELDLNINVSFAPYNQIFQQLLDPGSIINSNEGINVIFIRIEDWLRDKADLQTEEQIGFLDTTYIELVQAFEKVNKNTFSPFLIGIVPVLNASFPVEINDRIKKMNKELEALIDRLSGMNFFDMDSIARLYEVTDRFDPKADEIGHIPFTQEYYAAIGTYLARKIKAFKGPGYKVIALDCDNTLWKGVCGEAGAMNVIIDEKFEGLQDFILEKYKEGFLLVLCSKNNEDDVWEVFNNHPQMKLKRGHIAAHRINWDIKSDNLLAISKELNLGIDSFIFIDDSEFEIEQMEHSCPDVFSVNLPGEHNSFYSFLNHIWEFDTFRLTEEDLQRNNRYRVEKERNAEQGRHNSLAEFIESLAIKVALRPLNEDDIERAVQLSLRTNQFNLNGIRKTPKEIADIISQKNNYHRIVKVSDRFGDYGIVGLIFAKFIQHELIIETFLLSCRVLGRNVEDIIISEIQDYCLAHKIKRIRILFKPTLKNTPFKEFLSRTKWILDPETNNYARHIRTKEQLRI